MKLVLLIITLALVALKTPANAQPSAEDLYAEGQAAYDRADYTTAITKWQASYDLSKETGLLFNLAQAKRLAGDCVGAMTTYRRFDTADADATSDQHKLAKDFMRELDGKCPEKPAALPPKIVADPKLDGRLNLDPRLTDHESGGRSGRSWKIAGVVTGGVGVVTIAIGLGLGHHGAAIGDEITAACATSCDWAALKDKEARGKREVTIGKTLDVVGVAAIAGGALFYYLGVRQESLAIAPARGGGGVMSWSGSW